MGEINIIMSESQTVFFSKYCYSRIYRRKEKLDLEMKQKHRKRAIKSKINAPFRIFMYHFDNKQKIIRGNLWYFF